MNIQHGNPLLHWAVSQQDALPIPVVLSQKQGQGALHQHHGTKTWGAVALPNCLSATTGLWQVIIGVVLCVLPPGVYFSK